ncbi:hypothetical protein ACFL35_02495 [Candidatus Riflebacteria bacterium]
MKTLKDSCKQKLIFFLAFLMVTLVNMAIYKWPVKKVVLQIKAIKKELLELRVKNDNQTSEFDKAKKNFSLFKTKFKNKNDEVLKVAKHFFTKKDASSMVEKAQSLFKYEDVNLESINFPAMVEKDAYIEFHFEAKFQAPYSTLKEIFYTMEHGIPALRLTKVEFIELNNSDRKLVLEISASIRLLKFPS